MQKESKETHPSEYWYIYKDYNKLLNKVKRLQKRFHKYFNRYDGMFPGVPIKIRKKSIHEISTPLSYIINLSFQSGIVAEKPKIVYPGNFQIAWKKLFINSYGLFLINLAYYMNTNMGSGKNTPLLTQLYNL